MNRDAITDAAETLSGAIERREILDRWPSAQEIWDGLDPHGNLIPWDQSFESATRQELYHRDLPETRGIDASCTQSMRFDNGVMSAVAVGATDRDTVTTRVGVTVNGWDEIPELLHVPLGRSVGEKDWVRQATQFRAELDAIRCVDDPEVLFLDGYIYPQSLLYSSERYEVDLADRLYDEYVTVVEEHSRDRIVAGVTKSSTSAQILKNTKVSDVPWTDDYQVMSRLLASDDVRWSPWIEERAIPTRSDKIAPSDRIDTSLDDPSLRRTFFYIWEPRYEKVYRITVPRLVADREPDLRRRLARYIAEAQDVPTPTQRADDQANVSRQTADWIAEEIGDQIGADPLTDYDSDIR